VPGRRRRLLNVAYLNKFVFEIKCAENAASAIFRLFESKQTFNKIHMRSSDFPFLAEIAFAFLGFLSKNVTFEGFLVGDLPGAGYLEPLLGTGIRLDLWHLECVEC